MKELIEMLYLFEEPLVMEHSKFEQSFHFQATPLETAVKATADWFRAHPKA
jgi:hypothetical protein